MGESLPLLVRVWVESLPSLVHVGVESLPSLVRVWGGVTDSYFPYFVTCTHDSDGNWGRHYYLKFIHLIDDLLHSREFACALSCDCHVTCVFPCVGRGLIFAVLAVLAAILVGVVLASH